MSVAWSVGPIAAASESMLTRAFDNAGPVVLAVLVLLLVLMLVSWTIIGAKSFTIGHAISNTREFMVSFRSATRLVELYQASEAFPSSPAREMFRAGYEELDLILRERDGGEAGRPVGDGPAAAPTDVKAGFSNIERTLERAARVSVARLERYVSFLATVGSASPFIGLFGTVWGIMGAFDVIDPTKPILGEVQSHIAEALLATAIGLAAAIPAVMAYNWLVGRLKQLQVHIEDFNSEYLNILRRHFFS